jgi:hypothetical protein
MGFQDFGHPLLEIGRKEAICFGRDDLMTGAAPGERRGDEEGESEEDAANAGQAFHGETRMLLRAFRQLKRDASQLAGKHCIEVEDETGLARMWEATGGRFDLGMIEIPSDTRKMCPKCQRAMVLRAAATQFVRGQREA